jgi:hypothetical protein
MTAEFVNRAELRENIVHEDNMLTSRTTVFVLVTTVLYAALTISGSFKFRIFFGALGLATSLLWLFATFQSWKAITHLHEAYIARFDDPIKAVIFTAIGWHSAFGPTEIIALWIPGVFVAAWLSVVAFIFSA